MNGFLDGFDLHYYFFPRDNILINHRFQPVGLASENNRKVLARFLGWGV